MGDDLKTFLKSTWWLPLLATGIVLVSLGYVEIEVWSIFG
jgi:hypothetical protein